MSTLRTPVGPQPSNVYWRRRLVVGLGFLAVIVVILMIIFAPRGNGTSNSTATAPQSSSSASPSPSGSAGAGATVTACADGTVTVVATTDKNGYAVGELPQLSLSITNEGAVKCTFSAGSDVQEYRITSGSDQIWNSLDCQTEPVAAVVELDAGETLSTTPIPWDRTRSDPSTCAGTRSPVVAGGATYRLTVIVNEITSAEVPFLLY
jgi:hypothetical protein